MGNPVPRRFERMAVAATLPRSMLVETQNPYIAGLTSSAPAEC